MKPTASAALAGRRAAARLVASSQVPGVYAGFLFGDAFEKGLSFRMGQTNTRAHMPTLLEHIANEELLPEALITHRLRCPTRRAATTSSTARKRTAARWSWIPRADGR